MTADSTPPTPPTPSTDANSNARTVDASLPPTGPWWCRRPKPGYPTPTGCQRIYIPIYGFLDADDAHRRRINRLFHVPMLVLALLVLPILGLEYIQGTEKGDTAFRQFIRQPYMKATVEVIMSLIWFAFLVEFVVKSQVALSRIKYAMKNWLDLVIILLPLITYFQGAPALRALRTARFMRFTQVYRMRGIMMKLVRTVAALILGMEFVQKLGDRYRKPQSGEDAPPDYTQWSRAALLSEIDSLRERVKEVEAENANQLAELQKREVAARATKPGTEDRR